MIVKIILNSTEVEKAITLGSLLALVKDLKENDVKTEDVSSSLRNMPTEDNSTPVESVKVQPENPVETKPEELVGSTVPISAKTYTRDELSMAAIGLMDLGKQAELINLLNNVFGVVSIPELPKEKYSEFANKLRELGANI